jgi:hypothetical protein
VERESGQHGELALPVVGSWGLLMAPSSAGTQRQVLWLSLLRLLLFKLLLLDVLLTCSHLRLHVLAGQHLQPPPSRKSLPPTHRIWT